MPALAKGKSLIKLVIVRHVNEQASRWCAVAHIFKRFIAQNIITGIQAVLVSIHTQRAWQKEADYTGKGRWDKFIDVRLEIKLVQLLPLASCHITGHPIYVKGKAQIFQRLRKAAEDKTIEIMLGWWQQLSRFSFNRPFGKFSPARPFVYIVVT